MDNNHLWELVQQNAQHIRVINSELSDIIARLSVVETKINLVVGILVALATKASWEILNHFRNRK